MYDTVHFWLSRETSKGIPTKEVINSLSNISAITNLENSRDYFRGHLDNLNVGIFESGVSVKGSISKYYLKDNFATLLFGEVKPCIEMLSDKLHLPMHKANIHRLDIAQHFILQHPEQVYYPLLGKSTFYRRLEQNNGVYYTNTNRQLLFYGKVHEQKKKGQLIPPLYAERSVLRYEYRFLQRLPSFFNVANVTGALLYDLDFFCEAITKWETEYLAIRKKRILTIELESLQTIKDFEQALSISGLNALGGELAIISQIDLAKQAGLFKNKMQVKRLKDKIKQLSNTPRLTSHNELILELSNKITQAVSCYY
ncbi:phage/plasmid replication domain-containing protein [Pontibacter populi]|uniref:Phage/plasmid replication protein n=1 Tax=Pontibacter populi TaxID=890055 RepID=A0ABV1RXG1_9BACT